MTKIAKQRKSKRKAPPHAWKPGQSGNPKGRTPTGTTVAEWSREVLESKHQGDKSKCQAILSKFIELALAGSKPHAEFVFERAYGKVKDVIETLPPPVDPETAQWLKYVEEDAAARTAYLAYLKAHRES